MAGFTPYQQAGGWTPWSMALSDTAPPIEPDAHRIGQVPVCSCTQSTRWVTSSVEASLPHDSPWNCEDATAHPSRRIAASSGPSDLSLTPAPWPWNHTTTPLGTSRSGRFSRTGWPSSRSRSTSPARPAMGVAATGSARLPVEIGRALGAASSPSPVRLAVATAATAATIMSTAIRSTRTRRMGSAFRDA